MRRFKGTLWKYYPQSFNTPPQSLDLVDLVDRLLECYGLEVSMQITKTLLEEMKKSKIVEFLQTLCLQSKDEPARVDVFSAAFIRLSLCLFAGCLKK